ncbi:MAG: conserved rane protein of unknown function [Nitrospira sp.]|nr:conserved rane protein of unknown function [Nitrospira sp.]
MFNGFDKDLLMLGGTVAGFLAALLSILEKVLHLQERLVTPKDKQPMAASVASLSAKPVQTDHFNTKAFQKSSSLFLYETGVIVAAGILLNYLGLTLSRHLHSILFLDMTGTALTAFLLGPWWGAIAALVSNSVVNWLLYPEAGADVVIFPWSLVNMTGGFFWGLMARRSGFRTYLRAGRNSLLTHVWFLLSFGVMGAVVMSVPGTLVQAALGEDSIFALTPDVAMTLKLTVMRWEDAVRLYLESVIGLTWGDSLGWTIVNWFQNCIRYIPDKTFSAAIALVVLKYGYPLFERELIHGGPDNERPGDERLLPLVLGLLYAPSFGTLVLSVPYAGSSYWPLWTAPWVVIAAGYFALHRWGLLADDLQTSRRHRAARYAKALKLIGREPSYEFCRRLTLVTLMASLIFALCLPILLVDFYRVAFNFFCVVYGFLLLVHLVRVAIVQNLSVARAED